MNALLLDGFWSFTEGLAESVDDTRWRYWPCSAGENSLKHWQLDNGCRESIHTSCPRSASAYRSSRTKPSSALLWERKRPTIGGDCRVGARVTGLGTKRGPQFGAGLCFAPMTLT